MSLVMDIDVDSTLLRPNGTPIELEVARTATQQAAAERVEPASTAIPKVAHFDTCAICLSALEQRAVAYPCNHLTFDFICLASWLEHRQTCPLCNTPVTRVEYDWRGPNDFKVFYPPSQDKKTGQQAHSTRPLGRPSVRLPGRRRPPQPPPPPLTSPDHALDRRRLVYERHCFSLHRAPSRPQAAVTPEVFRSSPQMQRKARTFLRRELRVFTFISSTPSRTEFVLSYIMGMLCRLEMKGADGAMENLVAEVLGRQEARLLIHELHSWLSCAFDRLEDWDRFVQYGDREVMRFGHDRATTRDNGARVDKREA